MAKKYDVIVVGAGPAPITITSYFITLPSSFPSGWGLSQDSIENIGLTCSLPCVFTTCKINQPGANRSSAGSGFLLQN